jgi:esterase/lipase superfamily enzyme
MSHPYPDRRRFLAAAAVAGAAAAGGCAPGLATGSLGADGAARQVLPVLTTRAASGDGRTRPWFGAERAGRPTALRAELFPAEGLLAGRIAAIEPLDGEAFAAFAAASGDSQALLYTHGYNESFESALVSCAGLAAGIGFRGAPALFTWPSRAGLLDYGFDRESALWSRDALEDAIVALLRRSSGMTHLIAHSLGSHLMLEALRQVKLRHGDAYDPRIGAIVLAAPDIDLDLFGRLVGRLGDLLPRITVIVATNDRALAVSGRLSGAARVGAADRGALERFGVRVVDATEQAGGLLRHDVFLTSAEVRAVIARAISRAA